MAVDEKYIVYGLSLSYFTGKLEAYFRAKGLGYALREISSKEFARFGAQTGVRQMPQVVTPDGRVLSDTTAIIAEFEDLRTEPQLRPRDKLTAFYSILFEDLFDEWLWRPALYYRWAFPEDRKLMGSQIARTMLRDVPGPHLLRRLFIEYRQRRVFLSGDGVAKANRFAVEALFHETLAALEKVFAKRPFLFGDRPCEADFGLFGPFFRHFSSDPTPAAIMRAEAPNTLLWVSRLWAITPQAFNDKPRLTTVPDDLEFFFDLLSTEYLPYLAANGQALSTLSASAAGNASVHASSRGGSFRTKPAPYHGACLAELQRAYQALGPSQQVHVTDKIGKATSILAARPQESTHKPGVVDRLGRPQ